MQIELSSGIKIGDGAPTYIIAEIGSNFSSLEDCLSSVAASAQCGANAVKFQLFSHQSLYGFPGKMKGELNPEWLPVLKKCADDNHIELMCSAFSPELIDVVDKFVNIHKLASAEMAHVGMLAKFREIGKPLIMSTGAHTEMEIRKALAILHSVDIDVTSPPPIVLMYCVASYPARDIDVDLIPIFRERFGCLVGYSDHSLDIGIIPRNSVRRGACVVEKHFQAVPGTFPDTGHSLDATGFARMVRTIRSVNDEVIGPIEPNDCENEMLTKHNRRLIATREIKPGDAFEEGNNFGIYRALRGLPDALSPFSIGEVIRKRSSKSLSPGDAISKDCIQ